MSRPSSASMGKKIPFKETPEELEYVDLKYQKYEDYDDKMTKESLIKFILGEVESMQGQVKNDVCNQPSIMLAWSRRFNHL